jgi:hypothetical protein
MGNIAVETLATTSEFDEVNERVHNEILSANSKADELEHFFSQLLAEQEYQVKEKINKEKHTMTLNVNYDIEHKPVLDKQFSELDDLVANVKGNLKEVLVANETLTRTIESKDTTIQEYEKEAQAFAARRVEDAQHIKVLEDEIAEKQDKIENKNRDINFLQEENRSLIAENETRQSRDQAQEQKLQSLKSTLSGLFSSVSSEVKQEQNDK